jgi:hypothetical protein
MRARQSFDRFKGRLRNYSMQWIQQRQQQRVSLQVTDNICMYVCV